MRAWNPTCATTNLLEFKTKQTGYNYDSKSTVKELRLKLDEAVVRILTFSERLVWATVWLTLPARSSLARSEDGRARLAEGGGHMQIFGVHFRSKWATLGDSDGDRAGRVSPPTAARLA